MPAPPIIAGLWGMTRLHAFLIEEEREPVVRSGPGVGHVTARAFESVLVETVGDWLADHPQAPIVLAGAIGSTLGWRDAGYVDCPARAERAACEGAEVSVQGRTARIVRGLACTNAMGEPDVLRGEETEALGWATLTPDAGAGAHVLCIPGTHAKWIVVRDGVIETFLSSASGELFAALRAGGVLTDLGEDVHAPDVYLAAVRDAAAPGASLPHLLFTVRARTVRGRLRREHAAARLSGLIVGADAAGAVRLLSEPVAAAGRVTVIGMPEVGARYADALGALGVPARVLDTRIAAVAGLRRAAALIHETEAPA